MSSMKFVSNPNQSVSDSLNGLKCIYPSLTINKNKRIVISNHIPKNQVCILSGGGSGHEPFATGFVGFGMLSGAVPGLIFASPPSHQIYEAIHTLSYHNNNFGILLIIANYTGDILNFGLAIEQAKSHNIKIESVIINDDCARLNEDIDNVGRRGMCGVCFVMKIAGAMAVRDKTLSDIANECRSVIDSMATLGVAVSSCTVPGVGPLFKLDEDEIEIGLGIHGEVGVVRKKIPPVDLLIDLMIHKIRIALKLLSDAKVCVMINNLGSVSQFEMNIICGEVFKLLSCNNISVMRMYSGSYVTSLDMAGFQISILNITNHVSWMEYLDAHTEAPAWNASCLNISILESQMKQIIDIDDTTVFKKGPVLTRKEACIFEKCLCNVANDIIKEELKLNELDKTIGDGDTGTTIKQLAESILHNISKINFEYPADIFYFLSKISQNVMGGVSGALYGILFTAAYNYLLLTETINWLDLCKASLDTLLKYSKAKLGDRTMIDVLLPTYEELKKQIIHKKSVIEAFSIAIQVAQVNCNETQYMKPRRGRASYVPKEYVRDVDAGAYAVFIWLNAIFNTLKLN